MKYKERGELRQQLCDNPYYGEKNMTDVEELKYAISHRDELIKQLADALSWYTDKPFSCSWKSCGICSTYGACSIVKNRTLVDKAREILKAKI